MTVALALVVAALAQQATDSGAGRPCRVIIDSVGNYGRQVEAAGGGTNFFAGGGVRAHCEGTSSLLVADSVAYYGGTRRFDMVRNVRLRDTSITLTATNATYFLHEERLEAHRNVVAVNHRTGSVLRGPNLTYLRAVPGTRDTTELRAMSRPTIEYRASGDTGEPYLVVGDRVRMRGDDRMWAGGRVTIDRSDFAARADSMALDQGSGAGVLVGRPRVEGKGARRYTLDGRRIELVLVDRDIRRIKALGTGRATGDDWRLTADTISLDLDQGQLQQTLAWGDSSRPSAVSTQHTVRGDSLALDTPGEVLHELRAFGDAVSTSHRDTTVTQPDGTVAATTDTLSDPATDWMVGDTLVARFVQTPDSSGEARTELRQLEARGAARAFTHLLERARRAGEPSINYSRGTTITVLLRGDQVERVLVAGRADGVHLEPLPPPPAQPDTTTPPTPGPATGAPSS